jgi:hypothetical protein
MCLASEDGRDSFDFLEMEDENVQFDLNVEELPAERSTPNSPQTALLQARTNPSTGGNVSLIEDHMLTREGPAEQNTNEDLLPSLLYGLAAVKSTPKVPRTIDLAAEFEVSDHPSSPKTTLMIRNIPSRYTQRELVLELEEMGFTDSFDFVYLPLDRTTRAALGYAFVNFVSTSWANKCMDDFQDYRFQRHRAVSSKVAAVSVAHIQGLPKNLAHYENKVVSSSKFKQGRPLVLAKTSNTLE